MGLNGPPLALELVTGAGQPAPIGGERLLGPTIGKGCIVETLLQQHILRDQGGSEQEER